jgi:hypothetical protein
MVRIYFTLDGQTIENTSAQFEADAMEELELAINNGNQLARLLLATDCTENFEETYFQLENQLN